MHNIYFYKDKKGNEPVADYLRSLAKNNDKDSRIKLNKIQDYINVLREYGTMAGEPYIKHIEDNIWELKPLRDRILFIGWINGDYILLHHFMKKTQKTPSREIKKAKRIYQDIIERSTAYE